MTQKLVKMKRITYHYHSDKYITTKDLDKFTAENFTHQLTPT